MEGQERTSGGRAPCSRRAALLALAMGPRSTAGALAEVEDPHRALAEAWEAGWRGWEAGPEAASVQELCARAASMERTLASEGIAAALPRDPSYPERLLRLPRPPSVIFLRGDASCLEHSVPTVAVVGSRAVATRRMEAAMEMARELAAAGCVVVSGGAVGIDTASHLGALEHPQGRTAAVLGSGILVPYPERNRRLFERIQAAGAVLSPFLPRDPPARWRFPARNRLLAALADVVVVAAAGGSRSGALITAGWARRLGIPVMAVPGTPGTATLLARGALLAQGAEEVLEVLSGGGGRRAVPAPEGPDQERMASLLSAAGSATLEELAGAAGWSMARTASCLLRMELAGLARSLPGGRYSLVGRRDHTAPRPPPRGEGEDPGERDDGPFRGRPT